MAPRLIVIAALGIALIGCVPQDKYNALKLEKDQALEELNAAQTAKSHAEGELAALRASYELLSQQGGDYTKLIAQYQSESKSLRDQYDDLMNRYNKLATTPVAQAGVVDANTANQLQAWASQFSDIAEFDKDRGMLKFKGDVTFDSGSAVLTPQAKAAIAKLSQILGSGPAANYELLVAGHTDNTNVVHPVTLKDHKDNWYLSAHRAIVVSEEMITHGIKPLRLGALGYADQRPVASNATTAGQARNRRVEVLLLPSTYRAGSGGAVVQTPVTRTPVAPKTALPLNKDSAASVEQKPVISK